jgi:hypothetical protein
VWRFTVKFGATSKVPNSGYRGHRFPAELIALAVWLYFRFPLSLHMVEDLLAVRGIVVGHEAAQYWSRSLAEFASTLNPCAPQRRQPRSFLDPLWILTTTCTTWRMVTLKWRPL